MPKKKRSSKKCERGEKCSLNYGGIILLGLVFSGVMIGVFAIINCCVSKGEKTMWLDGGAWVALVVGSLGAVTTAILGYVAVWQNKKAQKLAKNAQIISEKMLNVEYEKNYPCIIIGNCNNYFENYNGSIGSDNDNKLNVSTNIHLSGLLAGKLVNKMALFLFSEERNSNNAVESHIFIELINKSSAIIKYVRVSEIQTNLFLNAIKSSANNYNVEDKFNLNKSKAILPNESMYLEIIIISNNLYLNENIFKAMTEIKIVLNIKTIRNIYKQEIGIKWFGGTKTENYDFDIKENENE